MKTVKKKRINDKTKQDDCDQLLSERDTKIILELLSNPPKPNEALKKAFENYKKFVKK